MKQRIISIGVLRKQNFSYNIIANFKTWHGHTYNSTANRFTSITFLFLSSLGLDFVKILLLILGRATIAAIYLCVTSISNLPTLRLSQLLIFFNRSSKIGKTILLPSYFLGSGRTKSATALTWF